MDSTPQEGIYYGHGQRAGNSCYIVFLRAGNGSTAQDVGNVLSKLSLMYQDLKHGRVDDLKDINEKNLHPGNLSVLVGYGSRTFSLQNSKRVMPTDFANHTQFNEPKREGGGIILDGSRVKYGPDIRDNHAGKEHILLQLIGDTEFVTSRALIETWKIISNIRNGLDDYVLYISKVYTGFQRPDGRNWLGFHDGISNLPGGERLQSIAIDKDRVKAEESWTLNGTYFGFLRIEIDLNEWRKVSRESQEIIIGRDKITGCPLIDLDKDKHPIKDKKCPVRDTFEIVENGNKGFRESGLDNTQQYMQGPIHENELSYSHISRAKFSEDPITKLAVTNRIFRQGFEFFETLEKFPGFRVGLNFISFQSSPSTLFRILQEGFGNKFYEEKNIHPLEDYFMVRAGGIFFVPPRLQDEQFPGESIFINPNVSLGPSVETYHMY